MTVSINGSGSITGVSPGGLPDGSVQQADLAANVAGNGPVFSAYQNVAQSIPNGGDLTQLQFQVEEYDTASAYNAATGVFQPLVAGYYLIIAAVGFPSSVTNATVAIYKNGGRIKDSIPSGGIVVEVTALVYLNGSTDYVRAYGYQSSGAAANTSPFINQTYFQGCLVRAA